MHKYAQPIYKIFYKSSCCFMFSRHKLTCEALLSCSSAVVTRLMHCGAAELTALDETF